MRSFAASSERICAVAKSAKVTPATLARPSAAPGLLLPAINAVPSVVTSSASPATRPHSHGVGSFDARMPMPVAISRMPYIRRRPALSGMPSARPSARGASNSASPRPMLNQPRPRAVVRDARRRPENLRFRVCLFTRSMASSIWLHHDFHAAVLLVAEGPVHLRAVFERAGVRDHERWIDLALLDAAQQVVGPAVDVRLSHAERQALVHRDAERNVVDDAAVDAWNGQGAGRAAGVDHLAQHMRPVGLEHHRLLGAVHHRVDRVRGVRLEPDRVDAFLRALAAGQLFEPLEHAFLVEVDRLGAGGARHAEAVRIAVDGDHLPRALHERAADRELAHRSGAPDRHRVGRLDLALRRRLPAGRENIAEEQHLLVGQAVGNLHWRDVGVGHAHELRLAAGIAAGEVAVAEEAGGSVSEHLIGERLVAVGALAYREIAAAALLAFAATDGERHHYAVADLEALVLHADLHDLAHELV